MHLKIPPVVVLGSFGLAMWGLARMTPQLNLAVPATPVVALAIGLLGSVIVVMGVVAFRRARTTVDPGRPSRASSLVTTGIYAVSRNPMYLGFFCGLIAWAVHLSNLSAALLGPPVFVIYLNRYQIVPEEAAMQRAFGAEFEAYRRRVRRWL